VPALVRAACGPGAVGARSSHLRDLPNRDHPGGRRPAREREMYLEILARRFPDDLRRDGQAVLDAVAEEQPDRVITGRPDAEAWTASRCASASRGTRTPSSCRSSWSPRRTTPRARPARLPGRRRRLPCLCLPNRLELLARVRSLLRSAHVPTATWRSTRTSCSPGLDHRGQGPLHPGPLTAPGGTCRRVGHHLGWPRGVRAACRIAGLLHDIGKVRYSESLINKPGALTDEEFDASGATRWAARACCGPLKSLQALLPLIRTPPRALRRPGLSRITWAARGDPAGARCCPVDAYDGPHLERAYRKSHPPREALALLAQETEAGRWTPASTPPWPR